MGDLQLYLHHMWNRLKHENEMLNHRLSWLWALQGLLFASFGLLVSETSEIGKLPISIICIVGIFSSVSVGFSVYEAHQVLNMLHQVIKDTTKKIESDLALGHTSYYIDSGCLAFLHPWRFMPWVMVVAWIILFWWLWPIFP